MHNVAAEPARPVGVVYHDGAANDAVDARKGDVGIGEGCRDAIPPGETPKLSTEISNLKLIASDLKVVLIVNHPQGVPVSPREFHHASLTPRTPWSDRGYVNVVSRCPGVQATECHSHPGLIKGRVLEKPDAPRHSIFVKEGNCLKRGKP